jgi:hypothetical protein
MICPLRSDVAYTLPCMELGWHMHVWAMRAYRAPNPTEKEYKRHKSNPLTTPFIHNFNLTEPSILT